MKTAIELAEVAGSFLPEEKGYFLMQAMSAMLRQQAEQIKRLQADLTTQAEINAAVTQLARKNAVECEALKALADNPRNTPFGKEAEKLADDWLAANGPGGWIDDLRNKCEALEITNAALKADAERQEAKIKALVEALELVASAEKSALDLAYVKGIAKAALTNHAAAKETP